MYQRGQKHGKQKKERRCFYYQPANNGSYAYKAVMGIVMVAESPQLERSTELLLTAFDNGIKAVLTILFLSFGIALPGLAWSALQREN